MYNLNKIGAFNIMFCWLCIIVYQYSETNVMHFLFYLLRSDSTCLEHYFLILKRRCTKDCTKIRDNSNPGAANWHNKHAIYQVPFV
jgi:hypothetical protein